jgi:hypothetical protein
MMKGQGVTEFFLFTIPALYEAPCVRLGSPLQFSKSNTRGQ